MVIYGEYLFLENFIAGLLIIALTGKLIGKFPTIFRLCLGALVGAVTSFIIFVPMTAFLSVFIRLMTGVLSVALAFGIRNITITTLLFYIITFTSGGIVMAISLWIQMPAINHQGIIYMESLTYFKLLAFGLLAFGLTYWFVKYIRELRVNRELYGNVCLVIEGNSYNFDGFIDSGNSLREPISGRPVILIDSNGASKLPFKPSQIPERFGLIPYKAVGVDMGNLESIRTDRVIFRDHSIKGCYVAFYRGRFGKYQVLMNKDFLEGGILDDNLQRGS